MADHPTVMVDQEAGGIFVRTAEAPTLADAIKVAEEEVGFTPFSDHACKVRMSPCKGHPEFEVFYATDWQEWGGLKPVGRPVTYWELNT